MSKYTIEQVKSYFKDHGCELLEKEYKSNKTLMRYKCLCGNISKTNYSRFKNGHRCMRCASRQRGYKQRLSFEYVENYFRQNGCELLETEYKNNASKMRYKCFCGNISTITFYNFQLGQRCRRCRGVEKLSYEYVYDYFINNGCLLLEKVYHNNRSPMKYQCLCGKISRTTFYNFTKGKRCKSCGILKISGENNYNYNPNLTDEERHKNEIRPKDYLYKIWRKKVFKRDKYICQKCLKNGVYLNAHHIISWSKNKELRLEESNGITLCEQCHNRFHKIYGKLNNNQTQLETYLGGSI